jgi:hypothetical protein
MFKLFMTVAASLLPSPLNLSPSTLTFNFSPLISLYRVTLRPRDNILVIYVHYGHSQMEILLAEFPFNRNSTNGDRLLTAELSR